MTSKESIRNYAYNHKKVKMHFKSMTYYNTPLIKSAQQYEGLNPKRKIIDGKRRRNIDKRLSFAVGDNRLL